jgi:hypothetical protein
MTDSCDVGNVTGGYKATLSDVTLTGTTVSDMTVTYKIKNSNLSRVPKYRVEVVKKTTASDGTEVQRVIQAHTVILSKTATEYKLTNFPSDMFLDDETGTFKGLMLRAWLLESGKGLTYYYHEVTDGHTPAHEPNVIYADYNKLGDESGSLSGKQYYSYALTTDAVTGKDKFGINVYADIPTVANLEKPVITDGDLKTINNVDMNILEPTFDDKNQMYYI